MSKFGRFVLVYFIFILSRSLILGQSASELKYFNNNIQNFTVFFQDGKFAGWPANNGIWNWDDEIFVGFVVADHLERRGHTYDQKTSLYKYGRSFDGGETWRIEDAFEAGKTTISHDHKAIENSHEILDLREPIDFEDSNLVFTLSRGTNHNGPSHFYYSYNKGENFKGPFKFPDLNTNGVAARTDYIVNSNNEAFVFVTAAKTNEKEGRIAMFKTEDGGLTWNNHSWIGDEPDGFNIMSSSIRVNQDTLLTVIRSREFSPRRDYLSSFISYDNGENWVKLDEPVHDTGSGGSPPALLKLTDGRLALSYIYRSSNGSRVHLKFSENNGHSWGNEITIRSGDYASPDVGYPRMIQRKDGKLVIVYYWNHTLNRFYKPYRYIASSIVNPFSY